jgi:beta-fructofuranosidase
MSTKYRSFFQPDGGWLGDVIPWSEGDELRLYYLFEERITPKPGMPWHLLTTSDIVHLVDEGEAFPSGGADAPDFNIYTGSIAAAAGATRYLFYTGQNPRVLGADGLPVQLVMQAVSTDGGATWTRQPALAFGAPSGYETADWRDPFVFFDADAGLWRMLIAARHDSGPERRRGVIAQQTSTDLEHWAPAEPFWDPRRYITHECPEVFRIGDWWYLVYSEFSESFQTHYRMSRSATGPWIVPEHDTLDGRAYYAAKSAEFHGRRLLFGWIASREDARDDGDWQWAGTLSILEAVQNRDGTLGFRIPQERLDLFDASVAHGIETGTVASDGYSAAISERDIPSAVRAHLEFELGAHTSEAGVLLRTSPDGDTGYMIRFEPRRGRLVFDRWPRRRTGDAQWQVSGDIPFEVELERPCDLGPGRHTLDLIVEQDLVVASIDQQVTLSTRIYDHTSGRFGVFAGEGSITIHSLEISTTPSPHN